MIGFFDDQDNFSSARWVWFMQILSVFPIAQQRNVHISGT